jgi:hypothetical protein
MRKFLYALLILPTLCFAQTCPVGFTSFNGQCLNNPAGTAIVRGQSGTGTANKGGGITVQPGTPIAASTAEGDVTLYQDPLNTAVKFACTQPTAGNIATATCTFSNITVAGAGGGTPGGAANSVQYNNAGAFGGFALGADQLAQGTVAAPHAVSVPNCNGSTQALIYATGSHTFSCQTLGTLTAPPGVVSVSATDTSGVLVLNGPQTVDGVILGVGDTVLLTNQPLPVNNGIWQIQVGAWTRPAAPNMWPLTTVIPAHTAVQVGTNFGVDNQGSYWNLDTVSGGAVTVGGSTQTWTENLCNPGGQNFITTVCAPADPQFHPNGSHLALPTVSGVGCTDAAPGLSGDNSGAITAVGADTCTLTFGNLFRFQGANTAPFCAVAGYSATVLPFVSVAPTATAVTFHTAAAGTFSYVCLN